MKTKSCLWASLCRVKIFVCFVSTLCKIDYTSHCGQFNINIFVYSVKFQFHCSCDGGQGQRGFRVLNTVREALHIGEPKCNRLAVSMR